MSNNNFKGKDPLNENGPVTLFTKQLRTTARQKTQHGKCHLGEKPNFEELVSNNYFKSMHYDQYVANRRILLNLYKEELEEHRKKYYAGFAYRPPSIWQTRIRLGDSIVNGSIRAMNIPIGRKFANRCFILNDNWLVNLKSTLNDQWISLKTPLNYHSYFSFNMRFNAHNLDTRLCG